MTTLYTRCPISKIGCIECPIYRGRHCFVVSAHGNGHSTPRPKENGAWQEGFLSFFGELDEVARLCEDYFAESV